MGAILLHSMSCWRLIYTIKISDDNVVTERMDQAEIIYPSMYSHYVGKRLYG